MRTLGWHCDAVWEEALRLADGHGSVSAAGGWRDLQLVDLCPQVRFTLRDDTVWTGWSSLSKTEIWQSGPTPWASNV